MLKWIKEHFGLTKEEKISVTYPNNFSFIDNLDLKIEYLKSLENQETSRQTTIENKISQLIGQTGVIFSLLSLFVSNYFSKFSVLPKSLQITLTILFIVALAFYILTIYQATRHLSVQKYKYGQRSVSTVSKTFESMDAFKIEELKDLIYSNERNILINNQKADNLIYANRSFRYGTFLVGLLSITLILSSYFTPISDNAATDRTSKENKQIPTSNTSEHK